MIRILVINTVRFKLNGISAVIKNYYNAMEKADLYMEFVAIDNPVEEFVEFFEQNNLKCHVIYKNNLFKYFFRLLDIAEKGKFDIVHIHGNSANMAIELLACFLAGVNIRIAHSHNTLSLHPMMHNLLFPFFTLLCTERFACGQDAGKWLFHNKSFIEIKNGIEVNKYLYNCDERKKIRLSLGIEDKLVIGHVGNFIEQKNHIFLIDIFAELIKMNSDYYLLLISDGYLMDEIRSKVDELGIQKSVMFVGKTQNVSLYLQAMDIFMLPSLHEGLPLVLVEAQAAGLPCIVSDTVAREANLTNSVKYLPIQTIGPWVETIKSLDTPKLVAERAERMLEWTPMILKSGYDIKQNAKLLKKCYLDAIKAKF